MVNLESLGLQKFYYPKHDEKSASYELIKLGAKPIDFDGNLVEVKLPQQSCQLKIF